MSIALFFHIVEFCFSNYFYCYMHKKTLWAISSMPQHLKSQNKTQVSTYIFDKKKKHRHRSSDARKTASSLITAVDLFAGAGGFSLASNNVGIKILAAVEISNHACSTYKKNLIEKMGLDIRLFNEDITQLTPERMVVEIPTLANGCDLIVGGPPCQGFSSHRFKDKGVGDPRNELLIRYFHFVRVLRPRAFLIENVPGLLWERHQAYLERFKQEATLANYKLFDPVLLNACDYGVPQRRRRVFILGVRTEDEPKILWPPQATHSGANKSMRKNGVISDWVNAGEVFAKPLPENDKNAIHMNHSESMVQRFRDTPKNGGSRSESGYILPCHVNHDGHKDCYGRIDPSMPGPTMTTACINPSKGRFVHPTSHHGITLRHAARFQTFPDDFIFEGGLIAGGVQVGNAVPITMGEKLLAPLVEALQRPKENDDA
ncbi:MAG: DNA cytosine methyltransferase [Pseudomonadota bacterium]